ncbi:hypothetical protein CEXT_693831 [Caerostris extrusa]|uniref:Uncharacterized protein n=1 Tax=Caerostris extrusa TaxID=172846 RepID=A0AAV4SE32_CAEEX|nr:hypothetical protein CEXT_693831 [Caerostris extrusa]
MTDTRNKELIKHGASVHITNARREGGTGKGGEEQHEQPNPPAVQRCAANDAHGSDHRRGGIIGMRCRFEWSGNRRGEQLKGPEEKIIVFCCSSQ